MLEEQIDPYLIHSDVFSSTDDSSSGGRFDRNCIQFFLLTNEQYEDIQLDDDGDLDLHRPERVDITLVHRNETNVSECGYQLWNGALLLCDYMLNNQSRFLNRTILELGAGIGLCSLVASRLVSTVICTDHDDKLLEVIEQNISINNAVCNQERIHLQNFDWKHFQSSAIPDSIEIILAADVIYDDAITDGLFDVFTNLLHEKSKLHSIYITIEKRINFYLETLSVQCPAYEYFLEKLTVLKLNSPMIVCQELQTDLQSMKQCTTSYSRTEELVLWHIYHSERYSS